MKSQKIIAGILAMTIFLTGCGQNSAGLFTEGVSATLTETEFLQSLPSGVLVAGFQTNEITKEKQKKVFKTITQLFPKKILGEVEKKLGAPLSDFGEKISGDISFSLWIEPKKEEFLFAEVPLRKELVAQQDLCIAISANISQNFVASMINQSKKLSKEEVTSILDEKFKKLQHELEKNKSETEKFGKISLQKSANNFALSAQSGACKSSETQITEFQEKMKKSQKVDGFFAIDRKFFSPFLADGNMAGVKMGYKLAKSEAEKQGVSSEEILNIEEVILGPLKRMNASKILKSFEKLTYVKGGLSGNLFDRHSELYLKFSDNSAAELVKGSLEGSAQQAKIWISSQTELISKISLSEGEVYAYTAYKNSEYPSVLSSLGGASLLVGVVSIGILATGATALYASSQEKARDSVRISDIMSLRSGLEQQYSDDLRYPKNLEVLEKNFYIDRIPLDPKTQLPYVYKVSADGQGYSLSATAERLENQQKMEVEVDLNKEL